MKNMRFKTEKDERIFLELMETIEDIFLDTAIGIDEARFEIDEEKKERILKAWSDQLRINSGNLHIAIKKYNENKEQERKVI